MRGAVILAALLLSGCQTTRYVTVKCSTPEQTEQLKAAKPPKVGDQLTGQADKDIRPIAGRLVRMEAWGDGLLSVLEGCTGN